MSEQPQPADSAADQIRGYSFLHLFAHDGQIGVGEIDFITRLAERDGVIDDAEREALQLIINRIPHARATDEAWDHLRRLCDRLGVEPCHDGDGD
ncbi:MAG: hypothetical protein GC159_10585 [Phycisphaera sp.]|nr:hypothetical protein [Phycisphaera sp.]